MRSTLTDEYQDGRTVGSLASARRCWRDLTDAGTLPLPQRFTFAFRCPTEGMAVGLTDFLRYTHHGGFVRSTDGLLVVAESPWRVLGRTPADVRSLADLEHLFIGLRAAASRYESTLATLVLMPMDRSGATDGPPLAYPREDVR